MSDETSAAVIRLVWQIISIEIDYDLLSRYQITSVIPSKGESPETQHSQKVEKLHYFQNISFESEYCQNNNTVCFVTWAELAQWVADLMYKFHVNGFIDSELAYNAAHLMLVDETCFRGYHLARCSCHGESTQVAFASELCIQNLTTSAAAAALKTLFNSSADNSAVSAITLTHCVQHC